MEPMRKATDGIRKRGGALRRFAPVRRQEEEAIPPREPESQPMTQEESVSSKGRIQDERMIPRPVTRTPHAARPSEILIIEPHEGGEKKPPHSQGTSDIPQEVVIVKPRQPAWWRRRPKLAISVSVGLVSAVGMVVLLSTFFASTTVWVRPRFEDLAIREDLVVTIDAAAAEARIEDRVIPGEILTFTKRVEDAFPATGKKIVNERARGRVKIFNQFNSVPQRLIANTRFASDRGVIYRLVSAVTVPGAKIQEGKVVSQFVEGDLVADRSGAQANITGSITLHIPAYAGTSKYDGFFAIAERGFSGGFQGEANVAQKSDLAAAENAITKRVYESLQDDVQKKVPPGFRTIDALRQIEITKIEAPPEGSLGETFGLAAEATARVFIFRDMELLAVYQSAISPLTGVREFSKGVDALSLRAREVDFIKGRALLMGEGVLKSKLVVQPGALKSVLKGRTRQEMDRTLNAMPEISRSRFELFPPWSQRAPDEEGAITVIIEE